MNVSNLIIRPEIIESSQSLKLLMKLPADRFSIANASVKAYTVIGHKLNYTRETNSLYSSHNLAKPHSASQALLLKNRECYSQLVALVKNILVEQFRIFVYLQHASSFF